MTDFTEDLNITADTILILGIDGTGNILTIDDDGNVLRGTGAGAGGVTGLVPTEVLFGAADGSIDQDPRFIFDEFDGYIKMYPVTTGGLYIEKGSDHSNITATFIGIEDGTYATNLYAGYAQALGFTLYAASDPLKVMNLYLANGGSNYDIYFPNAQGGANTFLKNDGSGNLSWASAGSGTVTSFSFTDGNGFDGTVTNATTTPALELTTTVTDNQIMYSTGGDITGSPLFTWDDATNAERFDVTLYDFIVRGTSAYTSALIYADDAGTVQLGDANNDVNGTNITIDDAGEVVWIKADNGIQLSSFNGTGDKLVYTDNAAGQISQVTLTVNDFDFSAPTLSIDYTNGQAASTSTKGFLNDTDWDTFNNKTGSVGTPVNLTAQSAAIGATTCYTTPAADGYYRANVTITITQAATVSSQIGFQIKYTNANDNVVKTTNNVNNISQSAANATGTVLSFSYPIYVKASTNIQYQTAYTSVGATAMQYDISIIIEKIK